jgi:phenylacetate-CoA ligase
VRGRLAAALHASARSAVLWRGGLFPERYTQTLSAFEAADPDSKGRIALARLRHVVFRAYHTVPYYKRSFDAAGVNPRDLRTAEDLRYFPLLDKRALIEHAGALVATGRERIGARWDATGGSTGEPVRFLRSRRAWAVNYANEHRVWRWYGVGRGARWAHIWGSDRDVPPDQAHDDWRNRLLGSCRLNAFWLDEERCRRFSAILAGFQPEIVYGYATALARFSAWLRDAGVRLAIRPRAIRATAEVLMPEHRALIEEQFHGPVYDYYGSREVGAIAGESPARTGLHVFSDVTHVEILRPDGSACEPGEVGEVVVTKLHESAMPFVRYRIGDRAAPVAGGGDALGFPRITGIQGRIGDFVRTADGREIHGEYFTHLFYGVSGVLRFQVQQPRRDRLRILVEATEEARAAELEHLRLEAAKQFSPQEPEAVTLERVAEIRPGASGKHRFVLPFGA